MFLHFTCHFFTTKYQGKIETLCIALMLHSYTVGATAKQHTIKISVQKTSDL